MPRGYFNERNYYEWELEDGDLIVYSECCADTFDTEQKLALFFALSDDLGYKVWPRTS